MFSKLVLAFSILTGCTTLQVLETKYIPGDCIRVTDKAAKEDKDLAQAQKIDLFVVGLIRGGYVLLRAYDGELLDQAAVKTEETDSVTEKVECSVVFDQLK